MSIRGEEEVRPGEEADYEEGAAWAVSSADANGGGSGLGEGEQSGAHVIDDRETRHADNRGREHFLAKRVEGERRAANSVGWRAMCKRCERPSKVCICSSLPKRPIAIETRLIILQHPKERKKATYGTVPIVRLVIKDVHWSLVDQVSILLYICDIYIIVFQNASPWKNNQWNKTENNLI
jgi:hypothetical protein